jgi:hypothetical protein
MIFLLVHGLSLSAGQTNCLCYQSVGETLYPHYSYCADVRGQVDGVFVSDQNALKMLSSVAMVGGRRQYIVPDQDRRAFRGRGLLRKE